MKPGLKTTAFWLVIGYLLLSTAVLAVVLSQVDASYLEGVWTHAVGLIIKLIADPYVVTVYIRSRRPADPAPAHPDTPVICYEEWPHGEPPF